MDAHASARRLQSGVAKLVGSRLFWLLFVGTLFAVPLGRSLARTLPPSPPMLGNIEPFELHDQYGHSVTSSQLQGRIWVLAFTSVSAQSGASITDQRTVVYRTRNLGSAFRMITITTTPDQDTQDVRRAAVEKHASSANLWAFLGGSRAEVEKATQGILSPLGATEGASDLLLIDQRGRIRGVYATDKSSVDHLMQDISYVTNFP
jgi:protein SCO1/2